MPRQIRIMPIECPHCRVTGTARIAAATRDFAESGSVTRGFLIRLTEEKPFSIVCITCDQLVHPASAGSHPQV